MATFVIVHGGYAGGWQWRETGAMLEAAGHLVNRPTITGLGCHRFGLNTELSRDRPPVRHIYSADRGA